MFAMLAPLFEASPTETALVTGLTAVKTDVLSIVTAILPIALGIVGVFLAVRFGMKFFKSVSKG